MLSRILETVSKDPALAALLVLAVCFVVAAGAIVGVALLALGAVPGDTPKAAPPCAAGPKSCRRRAS
jgi:hypothetical protein